MKRLFILTLIMGLAAVANATLSISVDGDISYTEYDVNELQTIVVDVYSNEGDTAYVAYLLFEFNGCFDVVPHDPNVRPFAGDMASQSYYTEPNWIGFYCVAARGPRSDPIESGPHFEFDFTPKAGTDGNDVAVRLWRDPDYTTPADTLTINLVPEPMTLALVGLGGLLLRRRR